MSTMPSTLEENTPKLEAEKKFDQAVYGGISYFAQAATGIVIARWIREGSGKKYFDAMSRWAGPRIIGPLTGKTGQEAVKAADTPIVVSTMIMVGNAFLIPVKMLENHKPAIVRKWQESLNAKREQQGNPLSPEEREEQNRLLTALDNKPKQTWGSLGLARSVSLAGVFAAVFGIGTKNNIIAEKAFANTVQKGMKGMGLQTLGESETAHSYLRMIFNDGFYSAVAASGLYVWSHFVCPPKKHPSGEALLDAGEEIAEEFSTSHAQKHLRMDAAEKPCPTQRCKFTAGKRAELLAPLAASHAERTRTEAADVTELQR